VEFGISLPGRGPLAKPDPVLALAARADALAYASIFVTDHVVLPASMARSVYPYSATGQLPGGAAQDYLEPLAMLGCLARVTRQARLGTSVLVLPYRHPLVTAKILATIDQLSGGRLILGAGVGWLREEFEAVGAPPFEERGAVTDEYLRFMRATWTTDPVSFSGRYVSVREVHALPKPAQSGGIPVWIGGHEYAKRTRQIEEWAREAGRDPRSVKLTVRVPMEVRSKRFKPPGGDRPRFQGTAEQVIADIRAYAAAGVTHFVFDHTHQDLRAVVDNLERFAHDVRPKLEPRRSGDGATRTSRAASARSASAGGAAAGAQRAARGAKARGATRRGARGRGRR
jgi:probable F420-dependent oxidoreductase